MGKCVIFCAGGFDRLAEPIQKEDFVIAADGGWQHTQALGLTPDAVLGDFDSLGYIPTNARVHPVEKDDTDAMLAIRLGLDKGFREFVLYGSLDGPRLDHTVANFQALQFLQDRGAHGYLVGLSYISTVISGEKLTFPANAKGILSVFCMGADADGVNLQGLQYPLANGRLSSGFPLGVSNHFMGQVSTVSVEKGNLLIIWDRENGFPQRTAAQ